MAGRGRELKVYLTSDVSRFNRGLNSAQSRLSKFGVMAGTALAGAATAAAAWAVGAVKAAADQERANKKLGKTLENMNMGERTQEVLDFIDQQQLLTGINEDELIPAFIKLAGATGNVDTALALLKTAMDASVGSGKGLEATATAIAKATGPKGTLGALQKLIPGLDTTGLKAGDAASLMKSLNKQFGGQAATQAETFGGKLDIINDQIGEIQEAFGTGLIEALDSAMGKEGLGGLANVLHDEVNPAMQELGTNIGTAVGQIMPLYQGLKDLNGQFESLYDFMGKSGDMSTAFIDGMVPVYDELMKIYSLIKDIQLVWSYMSGNPPPISWAPSGPGGIVAPGGGNGFGSQGGTNYSSNGPVSTNSPVRATTRNNDTSGRGDARGAQRQARAR